MCGIRWGRVDFFQPKMLEIHFLLAPLRYFYISLNIFEDVESLIYNKNSKEKERISRNNMAMRILTSSTEISLGGGGCGFTPILS